jgi:RNA polymerase sigma-70 factor, ECF subfamily
MVRPAQPSTNGVCVAVSCAADQHVWYMQQVIAWQPRLYALALSLTGNPNEADDVLQNTNLAILRKENVFRIEADFGAWAMGIASVEVRRYRDAHARTRQRFDDALLDQLAERARKPTGELTVELHALRQCMERLSLGEQELLILRYGDSSVNAIADKWGRSTASISQTLYRIRGKLAECIKRSLTAERRDEF